MTKGKFGEAPYYPMVGFFFSVSFDGISNSVDSSFKEVTGMKMDLSYEPVKIGGDNEIVNLPTKTTFSDLTLSRGFLSAGSELSKWCYSFFAQDYARKLQTKDIFVKLLNEKGNAVMTWHFIKAYPVKMEIGGFNSMATGDSAIVIEKLTFKYSNFKLIY